MDKNKAFLLENKLLNYYSHLCNLLMFLLTKTFARSIINGPNLFGKFSKIMKCSYRNPCNSPRWVLDSPHHCKNLKFENFGESRTHLGEKTLVSPGLIWVRKLWWVQDSSGWENFGESRTHHFTIVNSYIANINCPKWRFFNYGTQEIRTVVLVLSCFLLFPTNSFKYL
jgi:hypothetical protein